MALIPNLVINFHTIYDPVWMEQTLVLLKKAFKIISIKELEKYYYNNKQLNRSCHLTFDDGEKNFYEIVFPLLKKHNIPATIFVSPLMARERKNFWFQEIRDWNNEILSTTIQNSCSLEINYNNSVPPKALLKNMKIDDILKVIRVYKKNTNTADKAGINMNPEQLMEIHNSGLVALGAHTMNHPILHNESREMARKEIKDSITELSKMLGTKIKYFAYPNGTPGLDFSSREMYITNQAGIKLSFSTESKFFDLTDNPFSIPRIGITKGNQAFILLKLIFGQRWGKLKKLIKGQQENSLRNQLSR